MLTAGRTAPQFALTNQSNETQDLLHSVVETYGLLEALAA